MLHRCDVRDGEGWRGADRTDEARKRHENHGNRGSSWIAALGQHACRQSPRSSAGTAMLRLLHDRGQAGEFDRRSRLRQRSTRRGVAQGRHRDDRAASQQQKQAAHARSATAKPLYATLARGALLCLDSMAAPHPCPLGILRPELPRLRTARLPRCPLQAILRQVLLIQSSAERHGPACHRKHRSFPRVRSSRMTSHFQTHHHTYPDRGYSILRWKPLYSCAVRAYRSIITAYRVADIRSSYSLTTFPSLR